MAQAERIVPLNPTPVSVGGAGMDRRIERKRLPLRQIAIGGGALLALAAAFYLWLSHDGAQVYAVKTAQVTVSPVTNGTFDDFIPVRGRLAPLSTVYLETIEGGRVDKVLVEDGATVKAGDPLLELSNAGLQLDVISREAQIAEQMNNLQTTELLFEQNRLQYDRDLVEIGYQLIRLKRDLDRKQALVKRGTIARAAFDTVSDEYTYTQQREATTRKARDQEQALRTAQAKQLKDTVTRLTASLEIARRNLDALIVRAPIDGQLTALDAEVGQSKDRGSRLGQIDSVDAYKITADIDEFYVGRVDIGQGASFTVGGQSVRAVIAKIYPQIRDGRFAVDLKIEGKLPAGLRRGQTIDVRLELGGSSQAVLIPYGAFYQDTGGNWIFVLNEDGTAATRRPVRLGRRNPQVIEVLEGLQPGERVITSSYANYLKMDRIEFDTPAA